MARYCGPVCRLCRRERMKLFLKGERCFKEKCAIERRGYPPGQHGQRRGRKAMGYGIQLREKQKVKRIYGVLERQFRLQMLERRLDNVVYSLGFAASRAQARQLVRHGHIMVDGRKTSIPSYQVRAGQAVVVREGSRQNAQIKSALESALGRGVPDWLSLDADNFTGKVQALPNREDIKLPIQEQLIVELYSR